MGSESDNKEARQVNLSSLGYTPNIKVDGRWTVEEAITKIPKPIPAADSESPVPFFHLLERLKTTKREGWRRFGIDRGESISDHMYRMSLISMFAPASLAPKLDLHKCMKMCLIHDMAELLVGDITPVDGVAKPEKSRRELETMQYLTSNMLRGNSATGEDILAVWQEYEDSETLDSTYVHDIDKLELLLQMVEYERCGKGALDLGEFAYVASKVVLPEMRERADEVLREREQFWAGTEHKHGEKGVDGGIEDDLRRQQDEYYSKE